MRDATIAWTCALVILVGCRHRTPATAASVQATIDTLIPAGSTVRHALRVLDSLTVEHSDYGANRIITANFGETTSTVFVSGAVYVTLYFDQTDRMNRREVKEHFTGP